MIESTDDSGSLLYSTSALLWNPIIGLKAARDPMSVERNRNFKTYFLPSNFCAWDDRCDRRCIVQCIFLLFISKSFFLYQRLTVEPDWGLGSALRWRNGTRWKKWGNIGMHLTFTWTHTLTMILFILEKAWASRQRLSKWSTCRRVHRRTRGVRRRHSVDGYS